MPLQLQKGCPACAGKGYSGCDNEVDCRECRGTGQILTEDGEVVASLIYDILEEKDARDELRRRLLLKSKGGG
mgnify:FL=1